MFKKSTTWIKFQGVSQCHGFFPSHKTTRKNLQLLQISSAAQEQLSSFGGLQLHASLAAFEKWVENGEFT